MRRTKPEKRVVEPDLKYHNVNVQVLIHHILKKGKKSTASRIVYDMLDIVQEKTGKDPVEVLETAFKNVGPIMEVRPRRVGGATYQIPMEVDARRRLTLAIRWILAATTNRGGRSYAEKLAAEILDASENQGSAIKKREESHKMAEANRAFSHFRF
jgi:small subunit ribosomal protein S7